MNDTTPAETSRKHPTPARRRKWLVITAITLAALSLLTIILLPVGVQYGLRNWLLDNGAHKVRIDDVDLNLFTGTLLIENISIDVDERNTLKADAIGLNFDWLALAKKRLTLTNARFSGIDIEISQHADGELRVGGILIPTTRTAAKSDHDKQQDIERSSHWGIGIDALDLADVGIYYRMPTLEVDTRIENLSLRELASWTPDKGAQVSLQASINGAPLKYTGRTAAFAEPMQINGTIGLRNLALGNFQQIATVADKLKGKLSLQTDIEFSLADAGIDVQLNAENIQLDELLFSNEEIQLQQKHLNWNGEINVQQTDKLHFTAKGQLASQQLAAGLPPQKLDIAQQSLETTVNLEFTSGDNTVQPNITALLDNTRISRLTITANKFPLAGLEKLAINKLALRNSTTLGIQQIQAEQFYVAKGTGKTTTADKVSPALFHNGQLTIEDLSLKNTSDLSIKNIFLKDANIFISRANDGRSNIDDLLAAVKSITATHEKAAGNETPKKQETTSDSPASFHIGHIQVSDDSTLVIEDASTTPMTRIDIGIGKLSVDNIDNNPPNEVTQFQAKGKFGRFGSYTMSGKLQPFNKKTNGKLIAGLKGIDLPHLSPYTARYLGFRLRSGALDSNMDIAIKDDQLSGKTQLVLHQLELIPIEGKARQGGMTAASLNTSLDMLRDNNNTITLDIPLSGDINAPDFSVQNAINQALMSGVKTGVMTYALLALQPYGTMVVMAKYAGEQISKLRLDPVKFAPESSDIDATGKDYLSKVASILIDRPKVNIKVCGVAVASDKAALTAALSATTKDKKSVSEKEITTRLKKLAKQRAIAVREYLISKTSKDGQQLIGCLPAIENDADALPRADLLI